MAPHRIGDAIAPGIVWRSVSIELGMRLSFEVEGADIHVEISPVDVRDARPRAHAARTAGLLFGYRIDGQRVAGERGLEVCRRIVALAGPNEAAFLRALESEARAAAAEAQGSRVREIEVRSMLEPGGTPGERYDTLSPYVGCTIGCRFCYAQERLEDARRLAALPVVPWGSYVDVKVNAPSVLRAELVGTPPRPIKFCPIVSDPYQAVEARYQITRGCLEALADVAPERAVHVLTRAQLVLRDLGIFQRLPRSFLGMSIPTSDDGARRHFEPRAASIEERLAVLRRFKDAGVRTFAMVQPMLPGSVGALADALSSSVSSVRIDTLHGTYGAARDFDAPAFRHAADPSWQENQAEELRASLLERGVRLWDSELPPHED